MLGTRHSLYDARLLTSGVMLLQSYVLLTFLYVKHVKTVKLNWNV